DHLRVSERGDETQVRGSRRKVDVAARLVRFGLERETQLVLLIDRVLAQKIDRLAEALDRLDRILRRVDLCTFASAPEDIGARAELDAEVHRAHGLLDGVGSDARVGRRERAVLETP